MPMRLVFGIGGTNGWIDSGSYKVIAPEDQKPYNRPTET